MAQIEPTVYINNLGLNLLWNCLNLALSLAGAKDNKEKPISTKSIKADQKYLRMQKKKNLKKKDMNTFWRKLMTSRHNIVWIVVIVNASVKC